MEGIAHQGLCQVKLAEVLRSTASAPSAEGTLPALIELAIESAGWSTGSITELTSAGVLRTISQVGKLSAVCDGMQYQLQEGPVFDAVEQDPVQAVADIAEDGRWARWSPAAVGAGVRSSLTLRLYADVTIGTLNLYSIDRIVLGADRISGAGIIAAHASVMLAHSGSGSAHRQQLDTTAAIGRAQGRLMQKYGLDSVRALTMLRWLARQNDIEIADLAGSFDFNGGPPHVDQTHSLSKHAQPSRVSAGLV